MSCSQRLSARSVRLPAASAPGGVDHGEATTALVTGSAGWLADVTPVLEKKGFVTHGALADAVHLLEGIRHGRLSTRSLDCYVQLPTTDFGDEPVAAPAGLRTLVAKALLARFDALAVVAPLLAPGARLVIVAGDRVGTTRDADFGLPDICGALAGAVLARSGAHSVRTIVVADDCTASDIAAAARGRAEETSVAGALAGYAALAPELSYVEWRDEVLGLVTELSSPARLRRGGPRWGPLPA